MKYYQKEKIDILIMPTEYVVENLFRLYDLVEQITNSNVCINDMHTGNIMMDANNITIIDVDLYRINTQYTNIKLKMENINALKNYLKKCILML